MSRRLVWSQAEKEAVFQAMVEAYRVRPSLSRLGALSAGQQVLPLERRIVVNHSRVFNHKARIEQARLAALKAAPQPANPVPTAVPSPAEKTPSERLAGVLDALLDILADKLADRLAERLRPPPTTQVVKTPAGPPFDLEQRKQQLMQRPRHNPEPLPCAPKPGRPGVLVLGLLNQSGEQLRREFADTLDIEWHDTDEATTRQVHPMAHVVMMTKFINHSVQERWRKAGRLHYCNGGVSQLRELLKTLTQQREAA